MSEECKTKNPLSRNGTSQGIRYPAALDPSYVSVDERNIDDILVQIRKYAEQIKYIGFKKDSTDSWIEEEKGTWIDFFANDISVILSFISTKNCRKLQEEYNDLADKLKKYIKDETKAKEKYILLYELIEKVAYEIKDWLENISNEFRFYNEIKNELIRLEDSYTLLASYEPSVFLTGSGSVLLEKIEDASDSIEALFNFFISSYTKIVNGAKKYLNETLESYSGHNPHAALLLTFLKLFRSAQNDLNNFTKRHLDFYYKAVLKITEKNEIPDKVHMIFELAKNIDSHLVEAGTLLKAGKDSTGKEIVFSLDNDIVVNKAKIDLIKNVYADRKNKYTISASPSANSADGIGGALPEDNPKWKTFGESQYYGGNLIDQRTMPFAEIGVAISSPVLLLREGTRIVELDFDLEDDSIYSQSDFNSAFKIFLSSEKEWVEVNSYQSKSTPGIKFTLAPEIPPIVNYDSSIHGGTFDTKFPIVKIVLNTELSNYAYEKIKDYKITKISVTTDVSGVTNLVIQNDLGLLKPGKPFQPFGPIPAVGSSFYIGNNEIFSKKLEKLEVSVVYHEMPQPPDFNDYYNEYDPAVHNEDFKAAAKILYKKNWIKLKEIELFKKYQQSKGSSKKKKKAAYDKNTFDFSAEVKNLSGYSSDPNMESVSAFEVSTMRGFIKLELTPRDFFHSKFAKLYAEQIIAKSTLPNQPYTPAIRELSLDYKSKSDIHLDSSANFENRVDKLFHIYPFGQREAHPVLTGSGTSEFFFPQFLSGAEENEGELYLGLSNINAPQSISVLFQVAEGSSDPNVCKPKIAWHYLSSNNWITFADSQILGDSTDGLVNSGIITFDIPDDITNSNTLLDADYYWLRASVTANSAGICDLVDIQAQAVRASYVNNENDPNRLLTPVSAKTISKLKSKDSAVKKISQPYSSFGGVPDEQSSSYFRRVSERLRHKHRASTMWDYERIVLEAFPEIYKVKCLNHTKLVQCEDCGFLVHNLSPGHVSVITIPLLKNKNAVDPFKPYTSIGTLTKIENYLKKLISPFICLYVNNPKFEEIQVNFEVRFRMAEGGDTGYYQKMLNEDIKKFLSPWAYDEGKDISFGGKIHKSVILDYIEDLSYVDYLTNFKMNHIGVANDIDEAVATSSRSVMVTISDKDYTKEHLIKPIIEKSNNDGISNYCKKPDSSC